MRNDKLPVIIVVVLLVIIIVFGFRIMRSRQGVSEPAKNGVIIHGK